MSADHKIHMLVLSVYRELADELLAPIATDQSAEVKINNHRISFDTISGDPGQDPSFEEFLSRAAAIIIAVRFLDVLSLEKIKTIYRYLPDQLEIPTAIFMLRDKGEVDFKISCPSCGQKLWLRDTDIGKRGRCPNCTKPFVILSQADHLKAQLMLPEKAKAVHVIRNNMESLNDALTTLLAAMPAGLKPAAPQSHTEALNNATMRIQIQET